VGQGGLKALHLWRHSQKIHIPLPKNFFWVQATRLAASFETLTRSVAYARPHKFPCKATCVSAFFSQKFPKAAGCKSVNITFLFFVSSSTAARIQLNFHSNLLCTYASRLKQISSSHQYQYTKHLLEWQYSNHQLINFFNTYIRLLRSLYKNTSLPAYLKRSLLLKLITVKLFCAPKNFVVPRNVCFKHTL